MIIIYVLSLYYTETETKNYFLDIHTPYGYIYLQGVF